jgi:hypothetical protein
MRKWRRSNDFDREPQLFAVARHPVRRVFLHPGSGVGSRHISGARLARAVHLDGLPDAALQQMGIARADIPSIVFRDLFTI